MLQLGARFYWPEVGRFVSQDPIGTGVNWYAYAESNPVVWVDPTGYCKVSGEGYMPLLGPLGPGGGGFAGKDSGPGGYSFVGAHVGGGVGGGFDLDLGGSSPGFDPAGLNKPGIGYGYGGSYTVGLQVGPANLLQYSGDFGWRNGPDTDFRDASYFNPGRFSGPSLGEGSFSLKRLKTWKGWKALLRPRIKVTANIANNVFVYGRECPF